MSHYTRALSSHESDSERDEIELASTDSHDQEEDEGGDEDDSLDGFIVHDDEGIEYDSSESSQDHCQEEESLSELQAEASRFLNTQKPLKRSQRTRRVPGPSFGLRQQVMNQIEDQSKKTFLSYKRSRDSFQSAVLENVLKAVVDDVANLCINNQVVPSASSLMESIFFSHTFSKAKKINLEQRRATINSILAKIKNNLDNNNDNNDDDDQVFEPRRYTDYSGGGGGWSQDEESSFAPSDNDDESDSES